MALPLAATTALTAGVGAYLNAKFHIAKDLKTIITTRQNTARFESALASRSLSPFTTLTTLTTTHPNVEMLWTPARTWTRAQVRSSALQWAAWFRARGVKENEAVGFFLMNSAEFICAWLGLLVIGAYPAMVNYNLVGEALVHCLKVAKARVVLVEEELADRFTSDIAAGLDVVLLTAAVRDAVASLPADEGLAREGRDKGDGSATLALRYTSGTTGFPKAVRTPVSRTYMFVHGKFADFGLRPVPSGDKWYICMPMCHATAGSLVMASVLMGVPVAIGKRFSLRTFWPEIRASQSTGFVYVGEVCRYLLTLPLSPEDKVHKIRVMYGNGLRPDVWIPFRERFGIPEIAELFGSTEGVLTFVNHARGDFLANAIAHHGALLRHRFKDTYVPVAVDPDTGAMIRDPGTGFALRQPYAVGGEVLVAVPSTAAFLGYYNDATASGKRFERSVFKAGDLFYRSGDALRRDDDGRWQFVDRLGDTFRWKSENVATAEVGACLGAFPGVLDANVYGVLVPGHDGRAGCAAITLAEGVSLGSFDLAALLRHARKDLPGYAVPVFLRFVAEPSMNNTHKQSKVGLRKEGIDPDATGDDPVFVLLGDGYVPFTRGLWGRLGAGKARL